MIKRITVLYLLFYSVTLLSQNVRELALTSGWEFRKYGDRNWMPAMIPGTVHTDLLANKLIPDPFFGTNEKKLQWIDTCDWEYRLLFDCPQAMTEDTNAYLLFEGLDTYADVYLNNTLVLSADNMFREWKVPAAGHLKDKKNELSVVFHSAVKRGQTLAKQLPYILPGEEKVFTRKAQYQYGWDWGPRFVTCGIWRGVKIISFEKLKIENVHVKQKYLSDTLAVLDIEIEIHCKASGNYEIAVSQLTAGPEEKRQSHVRKTENISAGEQRVLLEYKIKNPVRWWCNGMGEPYQYQFTCSINQNQKNVDTKDLRIGLRTLELVREKDGIGKSFYFKLNGIPVFMKGANYIPRDSFLPRKNSQDDLKIIQEAADANMNMLRVWGGGIYENESFYNACDKNGILVWQDFMFACAMYPGDPAFVKNVKQEAVENVKRLRNHPCLALWCGNNEIDEGWHNWGWQKQYQYSKNDSAKIWNDYKNIFEKVLPEVVSQFNPGVPYWPSSPSIGWGRKESLLSGDSHYWGVWWGMEPFETYTRKVGRFMSEYGFQGMPPLNTFKKFCTDTTLSINSADVKSHQKHPTGFETIQKYLERDYRQPKDFENYIYVSQLLQAEGMKTAIEAHRRAKPNCMGSLYWQLNDCWPVTSWSSIDYYDNRKALFYFAKHAFEKVILSFEKKNDSLILFVVSDEMEPLTARVRLTVSDFNGKIYTSRDFTVNIPANSSMSCNKLSIKEITNTYSDTSKKVLTATLILHENKITAHHYFAKPKNLALQKPTFEVSAFRVEARQYISLKTDVLAKNVFITVDGESINLDDNFFDLMPGEEKTIYIPAEKKIFDPEKQIQIKTLADTYQ